MAINRWTIEEVTGLLNQERPGLVELWNELPPGTTTTSGGLEAVSRTSQIAIAKGLALVDQQVVGAVGASVGLRPEVFDRIADLPGFDTLAAAAGLALSRQIDVSSLTKIAFDFVLELVSEVGEMAELNLAFADYFGGIAVVVEVVFFYVDLVIKGVKEDARLAEEHGRAGMTCIAPAYSAKVDSSSVDLALAMIASTSDWSTLFFPEARPFDPNYDASAWGPDSGLTGQGLFEHGYLGFTCCPTQDGTRVIAPIGVGIGNRTQSSFSRIDYGQGVGFGLLPMCAQLPCHRALIKPPNTKTYDAARGLPQLSGLGQQVWRLLWTCGPAAFTVDSAAIRAAWDEYLQIMRLFIAPNHVGIGVSDYFDRKVCDEWSADARQGSLKSFFDKIGASGAEDPDRIFNWNNALPIKAWRAFEDYQTALLERIGIAYVDATTCVPAWRKRVDAAQRALLKTDSVCDLSLDSIPNLNYRKAVVAARSTKGAKCYAISDKLAAYSTVSATKGPSTAPIGASARPIPTIPNYTAMAKYIGSRGGGGGIGVAATAGAAGLGLWALLRLLR